MILLYDWVEVEKLNRQNRKQFEKDIEKVKVLVSIDKAIIKCLSDTSINVGLTLGYYNEIFQGICDKLKPSRFFTINRAYIEEEYGFLKAPDPSYRPSIKIIEPIRNFLNR